MRQRTRATERGRGGGGRGVGKKEEKTLIAVWERIAACFVGGLSGGMAMSLKWEEEKK